MSSGFDDYNPSFSKIVRREVAEHSVVFRQKDSYFGMVWDTAPVLARKQEPAGLSGLDGSLDARPA